MSGNDISKSPHNESETNKVLDYVPLLYRRRSTNTFGWAAGGLLAAATLAWFDWQHRGPAFWIQGLIIALPAVFAVGTYLFGKGTECRIEGDEFWFVTARVPAISVPIVDIISIDQVDSGDQSYVEVAVRHKGRLKVDPETFFRAKSLKTALLAINPGIRFGRRSAASCGCCGANLLPAGRSTTTLDVMRLMAKGECPECHRAFPRLGEFVE